MARAKINKLYRTFVKGLVTEASPLTYPENASIGELNTVLSRKGNRSRRRGIRYEENFFMNAIPGVKDYHAVNEYVWHSVAKQQGKAVLVLQLGDFLHFWDMDSTPLSDNKINFIVDLKNYKSTVSNLQDISTQTATFSSGAGFLFIAHPATDPIVVEYNTQTNTYSAVRVVIQIRDFDGVYDGLANDEEPPVLSNEHHYNLKNQGWVMPGETIVPAYADGDLDVPAPPVPSLPTDTSVYYDPYTGQTVPYTPSGGGGFKEFGNNEKEV